MEALAASVDDIKWIGVEDASAPGSVRRAAVAVAESLGFSEHRVAEVAIAATELATNLQRHAVEGSVLVRVRHSGADAAVELIVSDAGPGVADLHISERDGASTGGTLGIGLGAIMRLTTWFDSHSVVGRGTVMIATFWQAGFSGSPPKVGGITRAINGEIDCGDNCAYRVDGSTMTLLLADGLGHGTLAANASRIATRVFLELPIAGPAHLLQGINGALRGTRGAAAAIARIDTSEQLVTFAGVGNVAAVLDNGESRYAFASSPGIVGSHTRAIREVEFALPENALVVLHSDGLTSKWDLRNYPGLYVRDAHLVAATLMRDAGVHRDDASVLVAHAS